MGIDPTVSQREIGAAMQKSKDRVVNACLEECLNSVLNVKALVSAFNQEKALVGAFSVITNLHVDLRLKLYWDNLLDLDLSMRAL